MRRSHLTGLRTLLLALGFAVSAAGLAAAADPGAVPPGPIGEREITIVNKAKQAINEAYVSPANADEWGDDRLGDDTIDPGNNFRVRLGRMRDCGFDVHIVYEDGSKEENLNVNACRNRQVAFDGSRAVAPPPHEEHSVVIVNSSARPIQMVFISPAESNDWGDDRLGDDSISVGASKSVTYRGDCAADLRIVFDNRGAEERKGLNLCDTPQVAIAPGWTTTDKLPGGDQPSEPAPPPSVTPPPATVPPSATPPAAAMVDVTVVNHSGHDAAELYVFPQEITERGPDRLGMNVLKTDGQIALRIPRSDQCRYTVHVVYSGQAKDADLTGLDLCTSPQVTLPPP